MKQEIKQRIATLRQWMKQQGLDAFIVPTTDPHNSEYVAQHWEARRWLTGFTGSAGTAVVTLKKAGLWTDSRYFLQAEEQLKGSGIILFREKLPETLAIGQWLKKELKGGTAIGIDGWVDNGSYNDDLIENRLPLPIYKGDPFSSIWQGRPSMPQNPVFIHDLKYAGESCLEKLTRIREFIRTNHPESKGILLSALDEIAWALNLRCDDVHCNPVFISYLHITLQKAILYINKVKLTAEVQEYLNANNITIKPYEKVESDLKRTKQGVLYAASLNGQLKQAVANGKPLSPSPVALMKCVKNPVEQEGFRRAMERDGVAMVKFLKWLKPAVEAGGQTELSIDTKLCSLRAEQADYKGISFDTIAGYGAHGAIVHYEPTPETDIPVEPHGFLLLDSGGQYLDGTTDITRTIALGSLNEEEKRDYTLVLKGMLQIQNIHFPEGTCGTQLDILARQFMWKEGINYLHGTGHGVGTFLCVHEGPHQMRMNYMPTLLKPGMTLTDEPGIYKAGRHGIRTENTLLIVLANETEFGRFFKFEPLTLCPIDKAGIVPEMMTDDEKQWLNEYHELVYNRLAPLLDDEHREWLRQATLPL